MEMTYRRYLQVTSLILRPKSGNVILNNIYTLLGLQCRTLTHAKVLEIHSFFLENSKLES